jgi:hypothetical protein
MRKSLGLLCFGKTDLINLSFVLSKPSEIRKHCPEVQNLAWGQPVKCTEGIHTKMQKRGLKITGGRP